ncbi:MAG TPA: plastocyanin/azurin family copper-binding protein [Actinomycetota bacterium]|jgi:plastocyanin|nr:plastocyanin/azurin family copper-binding protein [Actinomycetota bacterium]
MAHRTRLVVAVALVAALVTALLATGVVAAPFKVSVGDGGFTYSPRTAHVNKGRRVKWTNEGTVSHTVTFYKKPKKARIGSFTLAAGESKKRKIRKAGVYKYRCTIPGHSTLEDGKCTGMCGKVRAH